MEHTKGPYILDKSHPEWEGITIWAEDLVIAHVVPDQHDNEEANAQFIVRACNAHDGLVKALEDILPGVIAYMAQIDNEEYKSMWENAIAKADKALTAAKEA